MADELECKIAVPDHAPLRDRLRAAGATCLGSALETNRLLDNDAGALLASGCGLRVRTYQVEPGHAVPLPLLTYKGPQRASAYKHRPEIEVRVEDADALIEILHALGYSERIIFEKRRESWSLPGAAIELDEVPRLGRFIEIESAGEERITALLSALNLNSADSIRQSYVAMLAAHVPPGAKPPWVFRF
jgi:predicted adenylyl cyclase CyaB